MAEPWLDSLSEDWKSEHHSSSPSASVANRSSINGASTRSQQSRIPHLRQSMRKDPVSGNYLQPRSAKGIARSKTSPILTERSASSLNVSAQHHPTSASEKRGSTLPRRASSVFSESLQSVQHNTLQHRSARKNENDTPEWKKRLARGEDVAGEGVDLFGPSKLEGVFKQPAAKRDCSIQQDLLPDKSHTPWTQLNLSTISTSFEQPHTFRTSRSHRPGMEVLEELSEDEGTTPGLTEAVIGENGTASLQGFVKGRVESLERKQDSPEASPKAMKYRVNNDARISYDPRWRTISGQEELLNEDLSPVTVSRQNTIRDRVMKEYPNLEAEDLRRKLSDLNVDESRRPSSSSSDQDVQYGHQRNTSEQNWREESNIELTTHSLPEDLSMGTQEFVSNGGYVNQRRGGYSTENSFQRKVLSSSSASSHPTSRRPSYFPSSIRSSPPPYTGTKDALEENSRFSTSVPVTPSSASVVRHTESSSRPLSSGSPLKLFGNRDTYTNNKLLRVLSQFEDTGPALPHGGEAASLLDQQGDVNFRMSEFGNGDLDGFGFEQTVERHKGIVPEQREQVNHIFETVVASIQLKSVQSSQIPRPVVPTNDSGESTDTVNKTKRMPNSPQKDRTPKRRRTLLRDELEVPGFQEVIKADPSADITRLAGTKHRDSRSEINGTDAGPEVLASRSMLRPRSTKRRSSTSVQQVLDDIATAETNQTADGLDTELTEALAAELATFANGVTQAVTDSRKPSLATKDYMEEANKVMQFIRAKGKPKTSLHNIEEPSDHSELNPDAILDLDIDADSTKDSFSRPPSREGPRLVRRDKRMAQHDPRTASHLRKFKDQDDLDLLASTSVLGTLHLVDNEAAYEAALVPVPAEEQESSPPNIRILNSEEIQRKRKHSTSTMERPSSAHTDAPLQTQSSSDNSTRRTFPTGSSNSSGQRGMITSGTVSIPDQVGRMTFDHVRRVWVKEKDREVDEGRNPRRKRETTSEEDPFENIPDLSIDDRPEEVLGTGSHSSTGNVDKASDGNRQTKPQPLPVLPDGAARLSTIKTHPRHAEGPTSSGKNHERLDIGTSNAQNSLRSQISEHELLIHNGHASLPPKASRNSGKQPRVVTIAFSSPLVSAVNYNDAHSVSDVDLDEPDDLPLDDSELPASSPVTKRASDWAEKLRENKSLKESAAMPTTRHDQYRAMTLTRRSVSRIDEREEDEEDLNIEMSIVHVTNPGAVTPAPMAREQTLVVPQTGKRGTSIIALTPLSEFTLHQIDNAKNPEDSYVGQRAHPKSLRPAHGAMALAVDDLMKAITDAEPSELFWEQVRRLNLTGKCLTNLHGLSEYCSTIEELVISNNQISQLNGLPHTIRTLKAQGNSLSNLTAWGHLHNLQYVDISQNQLEGLDGFASLDHLRELNAIDNHISDMDGILDLDGLLSLSLGGNQLAHVNFEGTELTRLKVLDLSRNHLTAIRNLQALTSLVELNLEQNDLRSLSIPEGGILPNLRVLRASQNHLESLDLQQFPALTELYLDNNRIKDLPGLRESRHLGILSIREQSDSPDIINLVLSTPSECRELYLSSNVVPTGMPQLPELPHYNVRRLEIACCGISGFPVPFGDYFPNCGDLNLNFNAIKEIRGLQGMVKLERLMLAGNRIKRLRRTCLVLARLGGGPGLREVDLRENPLSVGFSAPSPTCVTGDHGYEIADGDSKKDEKWLKLMDEVTSLKRRMVELILSQGCEGLEKLNGVAFNGCNIKENCVGDRVWEVLLGKEVLRPANTVMPSSEADNEPGRDAEAGAVDEVWVATGERSVMID